MAFTMNPDKACVLAWEAMPDALHGDLAPQQRAWLDAHLAACAACRGQFAQQQRLQHAMSLSADLPLDVDAGLQRLFARIDNPDLAATRDPSRPSAWMGRALVAAVLLQAIGLGVMGMKLWSLEQPVPAYRTLSDAPPPAPAGAIRLVPDPAMRVADWDALLQANGLRVSAGPNDVGGYTVVPLTEVAGREALVQRLRAAPGIRLAEPVAGTP